MIMGNADSELTKCLDAQEQPVSMEKRLESDIVDKNRYECLTAYKRTLKANQPAIESYYDGYMKNYDSAGRIISSMKDE